MRCPKCKVISMYNDPDRMSGIQVYACLTCGNRVYVGYPKRQGEKQAKHGPDGLRKSLVPPADRTVVPFPGASKR